MANGTRIERDRLTVKEAASTIGMSIQWLYQRIKNGSGPPHRKRGRKIIILKDDLHEWDRQKFIP